MKTYKVTTYGDGSYTVSLDDTGVVDVDGLLSDTVEGLKASVARHMKRRRLSAVTALGLAAGPYSHVEEAEDSA